MAKVKKDDIDKFFDYNIEINSRTLYIGSVENNIEHGESGVDGAMAEYAIKGLHILDSLAPDGDKPINIIMNNIGGDEYHGMAIFDAIQNCKNYTKITVFGHAMSMGSIILQAANERIMSPNSRLMIHYGTWGVNDHPKIAYKWAEEGKKFDSWMEQTLLNKIKEKHLNFSLKKLQEMCNFDTFLNAEEALELGLCDKILGDEDV